MTGTANQSSSWIVEIEHEEPIEPAVEESDQCGAACAVIVVNQIGVSRRRVREVDHEAVDKSLRQPFRTRICSERDPLEPWDLVPERSQPSKDLLLLVSTDIVSEPQENTVSNHV